MGVPSVFLRTYGCNFTCQGFGMPRGKLSTEADGVAEQSKENPHLYATYNNLPLVSTGCDSYASWHPAFKDLSPMIEVEGLAKDIVATLPFGAWRDEHLVITGGEPLLGWQRAYPDLLDHPSMRSLKDLTFETNGTQEITEEFAEWLNEKWYDYDNAPFGREITFSVSPKLSASGEVWSDAIKPKIVSAYQQLGHVYLKFVVATENDVKEALHATQVYKEHGFQGDVYLMPVGGVESVYALNNRRVAELAMRYGVRYSDRLQVPLFKNEWGT
jgi:organic radical activating enzyme